VGGALGALPASASAAKTPAKTPANASAVKTPAKTSAAPLQNCAAAGKGWKADAANGVGGSFGAREMEGVVVDGRFGGSFGNRFDAGTESGVGGSFGGKRAHKTGEGGKETGRNGAEANRANKDEKKGGTVDAGEGGRVGVLFSGGVDSTALLACCVKLGLPVIALTAAYVAGSSDPPDRGAAAAAAAALGVELRVAEICDLAEIEAALASLAMSVVDMDVVKAGVALTTHFACRLAAEAGCTIVLSGGGSEELLAGYARHAARPDDATLLGESGLRSLYHRDLQRDHAAATAHGLELRHPFLHNAVSAYAHALPVKLKLAHGTEKRALRLALEKHLNVPPEFAARPKWAAQYGSRFHFALQKLAKQKKLGTGRLADLVASCGTKLPPSSMALVFNSAKDAANAYHTAKLQHRAVVAVIPIDETADPTLFTCADLFAKAIGLPLSQLALPGYTARLCGQRTVTGDSGQRTDRADSGQRRVSGDSRERTVRADSEQRTDKVDSGQTVTADSGQTVTADSQQTATADSGQQTVRAMAEALCVAREVFGVHGVIAGHVHNLEALLALEAACELAGLRCLAPNWGQSNAWEFLLSCRGGASSMLCVRGEGFAGRVVSTCAELEALVEAVGGPEAADGDAGALELLVLEAEFFLKGASLSFDAGGHARGSLVDVRRRVRLDTA